MSAITKLFVVLLVVCSLLLSASTVVFVARVEDYRVAAAREKDAAVTARAEASVAQARYSNAVKDMEAQTITDQKSLLEAQSATAEARKNADTILGQLKIANNNVTAKDAQLAAATKEHDDLMKTRDDAEKRLNDAQGSLFKVQVQVRDLDNAYRVAVSQQDALKQAKSYLQEQVSELNSQVQNLQGEVDRLRQRAPGVAAYSPTGDREVRGVVTAKMVSQGVNYATISVGSSENVARGMKFAVSNRNTGEFLGYLTIDRVDLHESSGRLDGPKVNAVVQGSEVRTVSSM